MQAKFVELTLKELCYQGTGFRQLAQITGIIYGIIQRIVTDQSPPDLRGECCPKHSLFPYYQALKMSEKMARKI